MTITPTDPPPADPPPQTVFGVVRMSLDTIDLTAGAQLANVTITLEDGSTRQVQWPITATVPAPPTEPPAPVIRDVDSISAESPSATPSPSPPVTDPTGLPQSP